MESNRKVSDVKKTISLAKEVFSTFLVRGFGENKIILLLATYVQNCRIRNDSILHFAFLNIRTRNTTPTMSVQTMNLRELQRWLLYERICPRQRSQSEELPSFTKMERSQNILQLNFLSPLSPIVFFSTHIFQTNALPFFLPAS